MASLPYPRTLYKMNMNLHTTLVSSAFFAFCLAANNAAAANNSASPLGFCRLPEQEHLNNQPEAP